MIVTSASLSTATPVSPRAFVIPRPTNKWRRVQRLPLRQTPCYLNFDIDQPKYYPTRSPGYRLYCTSVIVESSFFVKFCLLLSGPNLVRKSKPFVVISFIPFVCATSSTISTLGRHCSISCGKFNELLMHEVVESFTACGAFIVPASSSPNSVYA
jgi:hypothetical protein